MISPHAIILIELKLKYWGLEENQDMLIVNESL